MTPSTTITRIDNLLSCDLAGEAVMLDPRRSLYYGLNPVGTLIWKSIEKPCTVDDIQRSVLRTFDVSAEDCRRDVLAFLRELEKAGLIEVSHAAAA